MANNTMIAIDDAAQKFYETRDERYFTAFAVLVKPLIKKFVVKACAGSRWDSDELFSILLADMWRLINRWEPRSDKKFHWLVLRQLQNKVINYVHSQIGHPHKICPICSARQQETKATICCKCKSSLRVSDIFVTEPFERLHSHTPNYLDEIANRQLVIQLLDEVKKDDVKTHKILTMLLEGESKTQISNEVGIAQNALNNRLRKCRQIIDKLMGERT